METTNEAHLVLIADENGIANAFSRLKARLADHSASSLTLVYALLHDDKKPMFREELQSLEKRFSTLLEVKMIACEGNIAAMKSRIREAIEVILNCNIHPVMRFYASGNPEMVEAIRKILVFLGVRPADITTEIYQSQL